MRVRRWLRITGALAAASALTVVVAFGVFTRREAHGLITNPAATRKMPGRTPIDEHMLFQNEAVQASDGLALVGWYVRGENGALLILTHGYKSDRAEMLPVAAMLHRHGYGILIPALRAHDRSDGEHITFGRDEMRDFEAWTAWARDQPEVDPDRIALLGNSMGASLVIQYGAEDTRVRAVVADSAFSSLNDTVDASVRFFTGLPPWPFAPAIVFWAEREQGFPASDIDFKKWIGKISPRPVFLMQGGHDVVISKLSGQRLYDAAGEPKVLWYEPDVGHAGFYRARPDEYERRVAAFFDQYVAARRNP